MVPVAEESVVMNGSGGLSLSLSAAEGVQHIWTCHATVLQKQQLIDGPVAVQIAYAPSEKD
jgi:hypothetical protein